MSLWKVSDEATQKLMSKFYTNWVNMDDKHAAFHKAQKELMAEYEQPYYWGAFVMIGG
jgi:CHAT domain-containing protein